jgi:hypothetical protein
MVLAGFWRLEDKAGMSLDQIHFSGNVPQCAPSSPSSYIPLISGRADATRLQTSLSRFFQRLPCDKIVQRNNYFFKLVHEPSKPTEPLDPDELGWADYMVGAEDDFAPGRGLGETEGEDDAEARVPTPRQMRLRMERQTLRRLPRTRAVCFTIRTYTVPLEDLGAEPGVPGRAASAIRSWPADVAGCVCWICDLCGMLMLGAGTKTAHSSSNTYCRTSMSVMRNSSKRDLYARTSSR